MNAEVATLAALPQHSAERLRLSGHHREFHREAMPRTLLTFLFLLLTVNCVLPSVSAATWTRQSSKTMAWLRGVYFLDQNRGWGAGGSGRLPETKRGGAR